MLFNYSLNRFYLIRNLLFTITFITLFLPSIVSACSQTKLHDNIRWCYSKDTNLDSKQREARKVLRSGYLLGLAAGGDSRARNGIVYAYAACQHHQIYDSVPGLVINWVAEEFGFIGQYIKDNIVGKVEALRKIVDAGEPFRLISECSVDDFTNEILLVKLEEETNTPEIIPDVELSKTKTACTIEPGIMYRKNCILGGNSFKWYTATPTDANEPKGYLLCWKTDSNVSGLAIREDGDELKARHLGNTGETGSCTNVFATKIEIQPSRRPGFDFDLSIEATKKTACHTLSRHPYKVFCMVSGYEKGLSAYTVVTQDTSKEHTYEFCWNSERGLDILRTRSDGTQAPKYNTSTKPKRKLKEGEVGFDPANPDKTYFVASTTHPTLTCKEPMTYSSIAVMGDHDGYSELTVERLDY